MTSLRGIWAMQAQVARDWLRNRALWIMLVLPTGIFWAVHHTAPPSSRGWLLASWMLFAQVMTGLMIAASHWLEEREQGTWQALWVSPIPIGWLIGAQAAFATFLALISQAGILMVSLKTVYGSGTLGITALTGALLFTGIGVFIGIASPSQRSGSLLAAAVMVVFFLSALIWPGLGNPRGIHTLLGWTPGVLTVRALRAGLQGKSPTGAVMGGILGWAILIIALVIVWLHREYTRGVGR